MINVKYPIHASFTRYLSITLILVYNYISKSTDIPNSFRCSWYEMAIGKFQSHFEWEQHDYAKCFTKHRLTFTRFRFGVFLSYGNKKNEKKRNKNTYAKSTIRARLTNEEKVMYFCVTRIILFLSHFFIVTFNSLNSAIGLSLSLLFFSFNYTILAVSFSL